MQIADMNWMQVEAHVARDSRAVVNLTVSLNTVDFGYQPRGTGSI